ncbi:histidinol dehydrogenase [bacterium]|nr:MAG: histidinol dehydrogenase [bacterium]
MRRIRAGEAAAAGLYARGWEPPAQVVEAVRAIIAEVRARGDDALAEYTRRFDGVELSVGTRVRIPTYEEAQRLVSAEVAAAFELARARIVAFHERQRAHAQLQPESDGSVSGWLVEPLQRVGLYVPGGSAVLSSSVLMNSIPAHVAGVGEIVVCSPPDRNGRVSDAVLFACALCPWITEVYAVGGAQAVAALAYGTQAIAEVEKIVGPGNLYVTEAKRQVYGAVGIDSLAGPSEVFVVADERARPEFVAGELLAQGEHDPRARVVAASPSSALLDAVAALLQGAFAHETGRDEILEASLRDGTWLVDCDSLDEAVDVANRFAPEHLSVQTADPWRLVGRFRHAGAMFLGDWTPVAAGDYLAGSNHVLPTSGAARYASGLRVADFTRTVSVVAYSPGRMVHDAPHLAALADFEGLRAHARSARLRAAGEERG